MKNLLLLIMLMVSIITSGQEPSYLELRKEYREYCNQIVIDTVLQTGIVKYEIGDGLKLIPKDTVWNKAYCDDYVNDNYYSGNIWSGNRMLLSSGVSYNLCSSIDSIAWIDHSEPSVETFTTKITRDKYCKVKQERETQEGFWEWINKNYLK